MFSNENMPKISTSTLSDITGISSNAIYKLYNKYYINLSQKLDFDFKGAQLGKSREIISLYIFERLINTEINISDLVLHLKEIIVNANTLKNHKLFVLLAERDIKIYQNMANNYSEIFTKYFTDLVTIIKLLITSIKSHNIIGADFAII